MLSKYERNLMKVIKNIVEMFLFAYWFGFLDAHIVLGLAVQ
jgi:hypothetical protein